ncbi:CIC11C00000002033 [Sungouiella intermedia]|uniref:CIC11C00000002033 n=1 Tax=Sungouiella intermedia TaxID=45354 RepID=A0A1L0DGP8_9ASCO|nr:CIC11C00000002033 [[Candida] intermedia]SGZ51582.1 CIC11C00000005435 [[Candida] intermedia]
MSELPDSIRIDDIVSSKIDPETIYKELDRLKVEVNILRNDMSLFVKALATIPDNHSQHEYYNTLVAKLQTVKASIQEYCVQYNRLLPIINLALIKLGHEVEGSKIGVSPQKLPKKRTSMSR